MKKISLLTFLLGSFFLLQAQPYTKHIAPINNEKWWGCFVGIGNEMPFASNTPLYDLQKSILITKPLPCSYLRKDVMYGVTNLSVSAW